MPPRSARIAARKYLREAIAQGLAAEVLAKAFARRCLHELGFDEDTTSAAVAQVWREDFGLMEPN